MTAERMQLVPFAPQQNRPTWIEAMDRGSELAEVIANTDFVPRGLRGNPPAILAAILYGHELGLEPMRSLAWVHVIDGRPALAAAAQRALILGAGHELWVEESSGARAIVAGRRRDGKQTSRVTFTIDDAKRAGIAGKPNWQRYPRAMLVARATSELASQLFADVIGGIPSTADLDVYDGDVAEAEVVEDEHAQAAKQSRRRKRPTPAPPPEPTGEAAEPAPPDPASEAQMRKLHALFGEKLPNLTRPSRLEFYSNTIGRQISSSTELSSLEVSQLIDALEARESPPAEMPDAGGGTLPAHEQQHLDDAAAMGATERPPLPGEEAGSITEQQRRTMHALFRELGGGTQEERLAFCAEVVGHEVPVSTSLTAEEADRVIYRLQQQRAARAQ